jgi:hypothetical protein
MSHAKPHPASASTLAGCSLSVSSTGSGSVTAGLGSGAVIAASSSVHVANTISASTAGMVDWQLLSPRATATLRQIAIPISCGYSETEAILEVGTEVRTIRAFSAPLSRVPHGGMPVPA